MSIFVTGSASGIGLDLTQALIDRGHRVAAVDVDEEGLLRNARQRGWSRKRALVRALDVTDANA